MGMRNHTCKLCPAEHGIKAVRVCFLMMHCIVVHCIVMLALSPTLY